MYEWVIQFCGKLAARNVKTKCGSAVRLNACVGHVPCLKGNVKSILDVQTIFALLGIYQSISSLFFSFFLSDRLNLFSYVPCAGVIFSL